MQKAYQPRSLEPKWQKEWEKKGVYRQYSRKKKCYVLDMFPYPSGSGLHVGHPRGYIASDIYSRFKQLEGYGVLHPMGWDAFGLPAEQYAIKNKVHPAVAVKKNIATFKRQLAKIGFTYDWEREINTTDPEYYKWTQWIFLQMWKKGLAYQSFSPINWCPSCQTGLANEDLEQGRCERCDSVVEKKPMRQWVLKITAYANKMLRDLKTLEWPEGVKEAQRNWIGRSEGTEVVFYVADTEEEIRVFTTRVDTIYGCTYVVVAPEHPLINQQLTINSQGIKNKAEVKGYLEKTKKKTDLERTALSKEKTGVILEGIEAIHPFTAERLPVYMADYVLESYGTGAVMGVPAHDERDFVFAKKYELKIIETIVPEMHPTKEQLKMLESYEKEGKKYFYRGEKIPTDTKEWVDALQEKLSVAMSIIEVGSGNGWLADYYEKSGLVVECTDAVDTFVHHLEKSGKKVRKIDLLNDSLGITSYDCIIGASVLHHFTVEQFEIILEKFYRGLNTNGIVAMRVKKGEGTAFVDSVEGLKVFYKYWTEGELRQVLEKGGFVIEELKTNSQGTHVSVIARKKGSGTVFTDDGVLVASKEFTGLTSQEAREKMTAWLSKEKLGKKKVNYKLRDWVFSRQRYWGEPIPLIHCEGCGVVPVPERDLPVKLPNVKSYQPTGTGESPLADIASWVNVKCPECGGKAKRETNTMPQWAGSSWYYLRFIDPQNTKALVDGKKEKKMMPVDVYVGGDHATRHLIYARFWHKFLYDQGVVSTPEPFQRLEFLGLILASDGRKMSKRWGNVIDPNDVVEQFGADAFRLYEMFMGPFTQSIAWNTDGMIGTRRFLEKVWKLQEKVSSIKYQVSAEKKVESLVHQTIKKVTEDIEGFKFNTAVSSLMILVNALEKESHISLITYQTSLILLSPFAPHIAEELWERMGNKESLFLSQWPKWDKKKIVAETVAIAVQINGKVRTVLTVPAGSDEATVQALALADAKIIAHLGEKKIRKVIYVQDKILNLVV